MKLNVGVFNSLGLMVISAWMVVSAMKWEFRSALFPMIAGVPVFSMACFELYSSLFGKDGDEKETDGIDFKMSEDIDQAVANRRTLSMVSWILFFFFLILVIGFKVAIPLFFILYLRFEGKEKWRSSLGMAAMAWASYYGLFVWLLKMPFWQGWLPKWFKTLTIG